MVDTPGPGHNQPPPDPFDRADELVANANAWLARGEIVDDEQAGACQLAIDQLMAVKADLEDAEKEARKPLDLAVAAIRIQYRQPLTLVGTAITRLREIAGRWLDKQKAKNALEAAARARAAEDARQKANAAIEAAVTEPSVEHDVAAQEATEEALRLEKLAGKEPARPQIKGDYAAKAMSLHEYWTAEVTNEAAALRSYGKDPDVRKAALAKALQLAKASARKAKREDAAPAGFRFFKTEKAL